MQRVSNALGRFFLKAPPFGSLEFELWIILMFIATYAVHFGFLPYPDESILAQRKGVAFGGSAADPPHNGHLAALRYILFCSTFRVVEWYPSGFSDYKANPTAGKHRAQEVFLSIPRWWIISPFLPEFYVRFEDVYRRNRPTIVVYHDVCREYAGEIVTFYSGSDIVTPDKTGTLPIEGWQRHLPDDIKDQYAGEPDVDVMEIPILIFSRTGSIQHFSDPRLPNLIFKVVALPFIASSTVRKAIKEHQPWEIFVPNVVEFYIKRHKLHR